MIKQLTGALLVMFFCFVSASANDNVLHHTPLEISINEHSNRPIKRTVTSLTDGELATDILFPKDDTVKFTFEKSAGIGLVTFHFSDAVPRGSWKVGGQPVTPTFPDDFTASLQIGGKVDTLTISLTPENSATMNEIRAFPSPGSASSSTLATSPTKLNSVFLVGAVIFLWRNAM